MGGVVEIWHCSGEAVGGHAHRSQGFGGPRGGIGGGADNEFAAEAEQGTGGFDHERWRSKTAGGYQISSAAELLIFSKTLGPGLADDNSVGPPKMGAVHFKESCPGQ